MNKILRKISLFMTEKAEDSTCLFIPFGLLTVIGYSMFYLLSIMNDLPGYKSFGFRFAAVAFGIILVFHNKWPNKLQKYKIYYWYFSATFILPYFFTFMLLKNSSSVEWQMNALIIVALVILLFDWISVASIVTIGIIAGSITYYIADPNPHLPAHLTALINTIISLLVYCVLFSRLKEKMHYNRKVSLEISEKVNFELEKKVKERTKELEKALAIKTEFLNNMSHEIKTPIHGFTVMSKGLVENWGEFNDEKKLDLATQVSGNAERLGSLLGNLLDLSKFSSKQMELNIKQTDFNNLVNEIIDECQVLYLSNKSIKINYTPIRKALFSIDRERIGQVLRNLFLNALKYSQFSRDIIVSVKQCELEDKKRKIPAIHFTIKDYGVGVPKGEFESIFNSFVQSSRTKTRAGGTGLGLSICKQIILAHKGKIWAENNTNSAGASFHFIIPARSTNS
jgi:two-component system, sensor histidine kinase ChiS